MNINDIFQNITHLDDDMILLRMSNLNAFLQLVPPEVINHYIELRRLDCPAIELSPSFQQWIIYSLKRTGIPQKELASTLKIEPTKFCRFLANKSSFTSDVKLRIKEYVQAALVERGLKK